MFDISKETRNREAESQGSWMVYDEDTQFLVARKNNSKYKSFISKSWRDNEKTLTSKRNYEQSDKLADGFMLEAVAVHLLLDWKGVIDSKGKDVPYSPDLAMKVLEEHDDLRALIEEYAENRENYIEEQASEDAKNLEK